MKKIFFHLLVTYFIFSLDVVRASEGLCKEVKIALPEKFIEVNAVSLSWGVALVCEYALKKDSGSSITISVDKGFKTPKLDFDREESRAIAKYLEGEQFQYYNNMDENLLEFSGPEEVKINGKSFYCSLAKIHEGPINRHCTYFSNSLKVEIGYRYDSSSEFSVSELDESIESTEF